MATENTLKLEYNYLSEKCGLKVSNICFGCGTFGQWDNLLFPGQADEKESHALLDRFVEAGGNFLDTSNIYGQGRSETYIGTWMKKRENRDNIVLATKARFNSDITQEDTRINPTNPNAVGLSRKNIIKSITDSLERLQTHYIDLYQIHAWDDATPLKETLLTLNDLVRCGKVHYVGGSNLIGWQLQKILDLNHYMGFDQWVTLQQQYNLVCRWSEPDSFEVCKREGLGVLPWSPLCSGLLTDKVKASKGGSLEEGTRVANLKDKPLGKILGINKHLENQNFWALLDTTDSIAKEHSKTIAQVAIRYLLQKKPVSAVIIGAKNLTQLESNMAASTGWQLTEAQMKTLDEASAPSFSYPFDFMVHASDGRQRGLLAQY